MDQPNERCPLPSMSYDCSEVKPLRAGTPTDAQIRERAHQIWLERRGVSGNPTLDWLQAEMELVAEMRTGRQTPAHTTRVLAAAMIEARPDTPSRFAPAEAPGRVARAA